MPWYVAQTKPNAERAASSRLLDQGFDVFVPTVTRTLRVGKSERIRIEPLFPQYIFTAFDADAQWQAINYTRGVITLLPQADMPCPVPCEAVTELKERQESGEFHWPFRAPEVQPGVTVRLEAGPFWGQIGECLHRRGDRIKVLLSLLGRAVPVEARLSDISIAHNRG